MSESKQASPINSLLSRLSAAEAERGEAIATVERGTNA